MSIYSSPISALTTADLQELLDDKAVENVRLEFKREVPAKDETLKKLSSFANTFGGHLVVGAEAGNDGRITGLPGVDPQPSYKQTLVQWCTAGASPPLTIEASDAIPVPTGNDRVCYVVAVPESELAPHFLLGRKGLYVRTDEFSNRFEPRFATEYELRHLLDRRRLVQERREALLQRAHDRFRTLTGLQKSEEVRREKQLPVFLFLSIVPTYPARPIVEQATLLKMVRETRVAWRQVGFPRNLDPIAHHESALALNPCGDWSLMEANVWGMLSYAVCIAKEAEHYRGVHTGNFVGCVLVFLEHALQTFQKLGLTASLQVEVRMEGIRGIPWIEFPYGRNASVEAAQPKLDDAVAFTLPTTTDALTRSRDQLAVEILRIVFFAIDWPAAAESSEVSKFVAWGYKHNRWDPATP